MNQREINRRQQYFVQKGINERPDRLAVIQQSSLLYSGGGTSVFTYATVIRQPTRPDPAAGPSTPEYAGRAYYTLRLTTDGTNIWDDETEYGMGAEVLGSDNRKYTGIKIADGTPPQYNVNHDPVTSPEWWEVSEEIKVEYATGLEATAAPYPVVAATDLRDCIPWIEPGQIVPITSRIIGGITRWYIDFTLIYVGAPEYSSLIYSTENKFVQAVFA